MEEVKFLDNIGFRFAKCKHKRHVLTERNDTAAKRAYYLRKIRRYKQEKRHIVWLDGTFVHQNYTVGKYWQGKVADGVYSSESVGQRWIIVHAGGENGFVPGALLIFKAK